MPINEYFERVFNNFLGKKRLVRNVGDKKEWCASMIVIR
jgi:hypothetical protein